MIKFVQVKFIVMCIRSPIASFLLFSGTAFANTTQLLSFILYAFSYCMPASDSLRRAFFFFLKEKHSDLRTIPFYLVLLINSLYHCPK